MENKAKALLLQELSKFQQVATGAKKTAKNPHFRSSYADLESVVAAIQEGCKDLNLGFYHTIDNAVLTTFIFYSDGKEYAEISSSLSVNVDNGKNQMQAIGSAITYAKRYTLQSLFGLPSEDDDGQALQDQTIQQQPQQKFFTLETLETSKPKIEGKFKDSMDTDPVQVAKEFKAAVTGKGFKIPPNVETAIAAYCQEMAKKYNDEIPL